MSFYQQQMDEATGESEFNMAADTMSRIQTQLVYYNEAARIRDVNNMVNLLERVFAEISPLMAEPIRTKHKEMRTQLYASVVAWFDYHRNYEQNKQHSVYSPPMNLFDKLLEWEIELRDAIHAAKMYIKMKDHKLAAEMVD